MGISQGQEIQSDGSYPNRMGYCMGDEETSDCDRILAVSEICTKSTFDRIITKLRNLRSIGWTDITLSVDNRAPRASEPLLYMRNLLRSGLDIEIDWKTHDLGFVANMRLTCVVHSSLFSAISDLLPEVNRTESGERLACEANGLGGQNDAKFPGPWQIFCEAGTCLGFDITFKHYASYKIAERNGSILLQALHADV